MQSLSTQRISLAGQSVRIAGRTQPVRRAAVVVHASADSQSRRAILSALVAGVAGLAVSRANALTPLDLIDDRAAKKAGYDIIYEARDEELDFSVRDGVTQGRSDIEGTKKRVKESEKRIDNNLGPFVSKNYWTKAREELRLQVGTLRFDLNTLADAKGGKAEKKKAQELKKSFLSQAEGLDYALRIKNEGKASAALSATQSALDGVLAYVL